MVAASEHLLQSKLGLGLGLGADRYIGIRDHVGILNPKSETKPSEW